MYKFAIFIAFLLVCASANTVAQSRIEINNKTINRTICHIKFSKVPGLRVVASRIPKSNRISRVQIERFLACPYRLTLHYQGQRLNLGFIKSVTKDSIDHYEPGTDTSTGFFSFEDGTWIANGKLVDDPANRITVQETDSEILVKGTVQLAAEGALPAYFCFSVALIHRQGLATGFRCAPRREEVQTFSKLFDQTKVMSAK